MGYSRVLVGLGIALTALVVLSAGITLAAQWRALEQGPSVASVAYMPAMGMDWKAGLATGIQSSGIELSKKNGNATCQEGSGKHWGKGKDVFANLFANLTEISGTVKEVNKTKGYIVVASGDNSYNVRLFKVYVRTDDGVLILGAWLLGNVKPGDSITVKGFGKNGFIVAVEVSWGGKTYQMPAYYVYLLRQS